MNAYAGAHASDWFLNRAMKRLYFGAWWEADARRSSGKPFVRDDVYYAKAALAGVHQYRRAAKGVRTLEEREMCWPDDPEDSRLLLSIRDMHTIDEVAACIVSLRRLRRLRGA